MIRQVELVDRVKRYNPAADEELLNRAYVYAMRAHGTQKRASGDPYISHPLEVAAILTEMRLDDATIVAAVLHDTIEDTASTREEIDHLFGPKIGALVDGLTKLKKLDLVSKHAVQAENFRKLLLAVADDVRVLLVKLADRLHNMRTLHFVPLEKRERIARETLEIYAPLAGRMGIQKMREELEDLAFRHLMPEAYATISKRLEDLTQSNGAIITKIESELSDELSARGINALVKGRQKQPYSIWRKMERKSLGFEQLSDIYGFRVIVDSVEDCYRVIGVVHRRWPAVPGKFKDYISTPKQNDYRSIHTTVVGPGRQRVELQVRSQEMHDIAENGIAAHAFYKDGIKRTTNLSTESQAYQWLRHTIELLNQGDTPEEFLEHTKLELFHDQVFCFTPKGRLIVLPRGATPVDFAYAVHTDVGNTAAGAKINGRAAPLFAPLQNGDEVEINCAEGQNPVPAWEHAVVTGKARAAIRRATREAKRRQYMGFGRQIVTRAFERVGHEYSEVALKGALSRLARTSIEDVLAGVGCGEIYSGDVVRAVYPELVIERKEERRSGAIPGKSETGWFELPKGSNMVFRVPGHASGDDEGENPPDQPITASHLPIRGLHGDLQVSFAPDGGAVPGDRIVGILTEGEGITIYPIQSPDLIQFEDQPDRWLDVRWDLEGNERSLFPAVVSVNLLNEPGALGTVASLIGNSGANIDNIVFHERSPDFREITFEISVWDIQHLNSLLLQLRALPSVAGAERVNG